MALNSKESTSADADIDAVEIADDVDQEVERPSFDDDDVFARHRWPFTREEIGTIVGVLCLPLLLIFLAKWPAVIVAPAEVVAGLWLTYIAWSRKRRSEVVAVVEGGVLTVTWPHTTLNKRAYPTKVRLAAATAIAAPNPEKSLDFRSLFVISDASKAIVPIRVIDEDLAAVLLKLAGKDGVETSPAAMSIIRIATGETGLVIEDDNDVETKNDMKFSEVVLDSDKVEDDAEADDKS